MDNNILNIVKSKLNVFESDRYYEIELNEIESEIDRFIDKLIEIDKKDKYADRLIKKINNKINDLEEQKKVINNRIQENNLFTESVDNYLNTLQNDIDKNFIYRLFIKDIIISDKDGIEINWRI